MIYQITDSNASDNIQHAFSFPITIFPGAKQNQNTAMHQRMHSNQEHKIGHNSPFFSTIYPGTQKPPYWPTTPSLKEKQTLFNHTDKTQNIEFLFAIPHSHTFPVTKQSFD